LKTLVLLVNFGYARSVDDVPRFLREMAGREAPEAAITAVMDRYRAIGGASPLAAITDELAALLTEKMGSRFPIRSAYRYSHPTLAERIDEARGTGVEHIVFFVMSPYYASPTTGSYTAAVDGALEVLSYRPTVTFVHGWHDEPAFVDCWVSRIRAESPDDGSFYVFSAHSLPRSACEPYQRQVEETVRAVAERLHLTDNYALAWQSVPEAVTEPWIGPSVETVLAGLAGKASRVVEVPIGFVSDHLETRYDMDVVHQEYARSLGLGFSRIPSLNTYGPFISALAVILEKALGGRP
jgi:protoporphyrin/coproporphyrin ferrochelatase